MNEAVAAHLGKARDALRAGALLVEGDEAEAAINRSYYTMLHAARAALAFVGESPKTHSGVDNRFWVRFVQAGHISKAAGRGCGEPEGLDRFAESERL